MKKKYCEELKKEVLPADCKDCEKKELKPLIMKICKFKKTIRVCDKCGEIVKD